MNLEKSYLVLPGAGVNGAGAGVAGACVGSVLVFVGRVFTLSSRLPLFEVVPGINALEKIHNRPTIAAKIQVPFSSTSVVCLTPINWLLKPPIFAASPPPFGF